MGIEVIAIVRRGVATPAIEGIADDAAPAGVRAVDPDFELVLLDVAVQVEIADAGFHQCVGVAASLTSMIRFMRLRSSTTLPEYAGAEPP